MERSRFGSGRSRNSSERSRNGSGKHLHRDGRGVLHVQVLDLLPHHLRTARKGTVVAAKANTHGKGRCLAVAAGLALASISSAVSNICGALSEVVAS